MIKPLRVLLGNRLYRHYPFIRLNNWNGRDNFAENPAFCFCRIPNDLMRWHNTQAPTVPSISSSCRSIKEWS